MTRNITLITLLIFVLSTTAYGESKEKLLAATGSRYNLATICYNDSYDDGSSQQCLLELRFVEYNKPKEILKYDLRDSNYGCLIFGYPQIYLLYTMLDDDFYNVLLVFSRRGGDGENDPMFLQAFKIKDSKIVLIGRVQVTDPSVASIKESKDIIVNGFQTFSTCRVCDGWEVADPDGVFHVPVRIVVNNSSITFSPTITSFDKSKTIMKFKEQIKFRLLQAKGNSNDINYYNDLEKRFYKAIGEDLNQ